MLWRQTTPLRFASWNSDLTLSLCMSLHTAPPEGEPTPRHCALVVHAVRVIEHAPGVTTGRQSALAVHATRFWMLHVPGSVGHTPGLQPSPVIEQVWPRVGQFWIVHAARLIEHWPGSVGQLALTVHPKPEVEHKPGMSGH